MNIYKVTNIDTGEEYIANTEEVQERLYINRDNLYWHEKNQSPIGSWLVIKIGDDGLGNHRQKRIPKQVKDKKITFDDEIKEANKLGISYGQYKLQQLTGGLTNGCKGTGE